MRIAPSERVVYEHNPLAEVLCQVRFERATASDDAFTKFHLALADSEYQKSWVEDTAEISVHVGGGPGSDVRKEAPTRIFHFESADQVWRVSHSADFISLTCMKYVGWSEFKPRMAKVVSLLASTMGTRPSIRVGLRYKDVVEREPIGMQDTPWRDLLAPFVLGPLAAIDLAAEGAVPEADVLTYVFQSNIRLDDCKLLLQGGLLTSIDGGRRAFLVDSDFYLDDGVSADCVSDQTQLELTLERLHANAGALFSRTISRTLHAALSPKS